MPSIPLSWSLGASRTGLSLTARVRAVGSTAVTVVPTAGVADVLGDYEGTFNSPAVAATYVVQLVDADGKQYGTGSFSTDADGNEIKLGTNAADSPNVQAMQTAVSDKLDSKISTIWDRVVAAPVAGSVAAWLSAIFGVKPDNKPAVDAQGRVITANPASASSFTVTPLTYDATSQAFTIAGVAEFGLSCVQGEAATWLFSIVDASNNPASMAGRSLRFLVRDKNYVGKLQVDTENGAITINPDLPNQVTVQVPAAQTNLRDFAGFWELWDVGNDKAIGRGPFKVAGAIKSIA